MSDAGCVLVTGASRGLGLEFVRQYSDAGYRVTATCRDPGGATELQNLPGRIEIAKLDVTSEDDVDAIVEQLEDDPVDILISNAAVLGGPRGRLENLDWAVWHRVLDVNVIGAVRIAVKLWPNVAASGEKKIVFVSSRAGLPREAKPGGLYTYRSSKAALNAAARSLALDLLPHGVIVAMVNPGHVKTGIGGRNAPMTPTESVASMRDIIAELDTGHVGRFWHYDGRELPL